MVLDFMDEIKSVNVDGDLFVWIPKFYVYYIGFKAGHYEKGGRLSSYGNSWILHNAPSGTLKGVVHPAFVDANGNERDGFYVSRYDLSYFNGTYRSVSAQTITLSSKEQARTIAKTFVAGGHLMTYWEYQALLLCCFAMNKVNSRQPYSTNVVGTPPAGAPVLSKLPTNTNTHVDYSYLVNGYVLHSNNANTLAGKLFNARISPTVFLCDFGGGPTEHIEEDISNILHIVDPDTRKPISSGSCQAGSGSYVSKSVIGCLSASYKNQTVPCFAPYPNGNSIIVDSTYYYNLTGGYTLSVAGTTMIPTVSKQIQSGKATYISTTNTYSHSPFNLVGGQSTMPCAIRVCTYENIEQ